MSIGYDTAKVPDVTSVNDLLKPEIQRQRFALNGDPTQAGAAFSGVMMVAVNPGRFGPITSHPGVEFFRKLKEAGNFLPVDPTPGDHRVRPDAGRHRLGLPQCRRDQKAPVMEKWSWPPGDPIASFYFQAINKDAPHPAAARLWEEFLYSDEGQKPVPRRRRRAPGAWPSRCVRRARLDAAAYHALPPFQGHPGDRDGATHKRRGHQLPGGTNWAKAIG